MLRVECWRHLTLVVVHHGDHGGDHHLVVVDDVGLVLVGHAVDVVVADDVVVAAGVGRLDEQALVDYIVED